jgi:DNA-binding transcriptional MerR regulator
MKLYGITKDELYAIKEFLPWFSKESTVIPVYEDGQYKYIDFSRAFFYDTVTNPIQAIITKMEQNKDDPVLPGLVKGMGAGLARLVEPFVSESIWLGGVADIYFRGGRTKTGSEIWNERDSDGDKFFKTIKHLARVYSPGSNIQMERLYKAIKGETIKGTQYQVTDELLGLVGLRKAPLDLHRSLEINLGKFLQIESDERKLIYANTLTGDPVTDENQLIRQYIFANEQRLETFEKMRRIYDAARTLGVSRKDIKEIFESRNRGDIYKMIVKNKFKPLSVSEGMEDAYEKIDKRYGAGNPLTKKVKKRIKKLEKKLKKQRLNKEFKLLKEKEIYAPKKEKKSEAIIEEQTTDIAKQTPPLPPTSMPVANQAQLMAQKSPQTNLTRTEEALLSPSEKIIAART